MLQHYWWFLVSLLGALLVFLLFVQGGQSFLFATGIRRDAVLQKMLVNSTGRKWEFTLTTLATFGGAFFASFPLFYSTSFGGAYWVWMLICLSFVLQAVSYEYQSKNGNIWGKKTFQTFLFINGIVAPVLLGAAVSTLFWGGNFIVDKAQIFDFATTAKAISHWQPYHGVQLHGLEAVLNPWNVILGLAVFFLARTTALLYFLNNITDTESEKFARKALPLNAGLFVVLFVSWVVALLLKDGIVMNPTTEQAEIVPFHYWKSFLSSPWIFAIFLAGVVLVLTGIVLTLVRQGYRRGIWMEGIGVVLVVLGLLLIAGWNQSAYYPSYADPNSSLALHNSSSSQPTLTVMSYVSILIPFVLAYIWYAWKAIDHKKITRKEIKGNQTAY